MVKHKRPKHLHVYPDRHGHERIYFNRPPQKKIPLPGPLYSEAFWIAYHAAKAGVPAPSEGAGASKIIAGTIDALIVQYYQSEPRRLCRRPQLVRSRVYDKQNDEQILS